MMAERLSVTARVCLNCKEWKTYGSVCNPFDEDPAKHTCSDHLFDREDLLRRATAIEAENDELRTQLEAQRGGAVVVPELTAGDALHFGLSFEEAGNLGEQAKFLQEWISRTVKPIPADRVLADGMVGVNREYLQFLESATTYAPWPSCQTCERGETPCGCIAYGKGSGCSWWKINTTKRDALHSAKGEVVG